MSSSGEPSGSPRFSFVIPTYKRRERVVRNVIALDRQDFRDFEAIVVVDGSADGTGEARRALDVTFPLIVIEQENQGVARARIVGSEAAGGDAHRAGAELVLGDLPLHPDSPSKVLSAAHSTRSEASMPASPGTGWYRSGSSCERPSGRDTCASASFTGLELGGERERGSRLAGPR